MGKQNIIDAIRATQALGHKFSVYEEGAAYLRSIGIEPNEYGVNVILKAEQVSQSGFVVCGIDRGKDTADQEHGTCSFCGGSIVWQPGITHGAATLLICMKCVPEAMTAPRDS